MSDEREWKPGDNPVLPDVDPSCYPLDSVPIKAISDRLCVLCGNVIDPGQTDFCRYCANPT